MDRPSRNTLIAGVAIASAAGIAYRMTQRSAGARPPPEDDAESTLAALTAQVAARRAVADGLDSKLALTKGKLAAIDADVALATEELEEWKLHEFHGERGRVVPGVHLRWDIHEQGGAPCIEALAESLIEQSQATLDAVAAVEPGSLSWASVMQPLADDEVRWDQANAATFLGHVSADKAIRDAATEAQETISKYGVAAQMRLDVYLVCKAYADAQQASQEQLSDQQDRFLSRTMRDFSRAGLALPESQRNEIKAIKERLSSLSIEFSKNTNEECAKLEFTEAQLEGLPAGSLEALERTEDGRCVMTLKYSDYFAAVQHCKREETRMVLEKAFNRRCIDENTPILVEMIQLRNQQAQLLGRPDHASYVLETRMAKEPAKVVAFLTELAKKLEPLADKEMQKLLELKRVECEERGEPFTGQLGGWDFRYFLRLVEEQDYEVDHEVLREYFPLEVVTEGLLGIYQELLGLEFEEVRYPQAWHEEVQMFAVKDGESKELMGYFYLDLFPRDGKYGHAACFGLQSGCAIKGQERQTPLAACVCNFTKPLKETPSLLRHSEVETFFHEFGHVMHQLCASGAEFSRFSGTSVERDFVEAPSQMLENWCWSKEALQRMSKHHKTGAAIPEQLLDKLLLSKKANGGLLSKRQLLFGIFDQTIHGPPSGHEKFGGLDLANIFAALSQEIQGIPATADTCMPASFGHLAGGYDAQYYGYMWSDVFAADMFGEIEKQGVFSKAAGGKYRKCILGPGGSLDADVMLRSFLGRDPQQEAFLKSKGL